MEALAKENLIIPDYERNTVANVPATVAALFGAQFPGLRPLRSELWQPLLDAGEVRHVILVLVDGMGHNLVRRCADDTAWLAREAIVSGKITSVFPSTTVNALSCLWTGAAPAQHGLVGLEMFFPRLGVVAQMLALSPSFMWQPDALVRAGVEPETFFPVPGFAQQLAASGVETYSLKHYSLVKSSLSRMYSRGIKEDIGIVTAADLMWQVKTLLNERAGQRMLFTAYWAAVDSLSHRYGFDHPAVAAELRSFLSLLKQELLNELSAEARRGTVVIVTADHGQRNTPLDQRIFLDDHPRLQHMLLMRPAGEPRTAYLYARNGQKQAIIDYVREHLDHAAVAVDAQEALQSGLFGPPPHADEAPVRIGDVIVTMREGYALVSKDTDEFLLTLIGRHGGLTAAEMEVPFYAFHLG